LSNDVLPDILTGSTSLWGEHSSVITPENEAKGMNPRRKYSHNWSGISI